MYLAPLGTLLSSCLNWDKRLQAPVVGMCIAFLEHTKKLCSQSRATHPRGCIFMQAHGLLDLRESAVLATAGVKSRKKYVPVWLSGGIQDKQVCSTLEAPCRSVNVYIKGK